MKTAVRIEVTTVLRTLENTETFQRRINILLTMFQLNASISSYLNSVSVCLWRLMQILMQFRTDCCCHSTTSV